MAQVEPEQTIEAEAERVAVAMALALERHMGRAMVVLVARELIRMARQEARLNDLV